MARVFDIVAGLIMVFALTNDVAQGRSFHFDRRDEKSEDAAVKAAAAKILANGPTKELDALDAAVEACMHKVNKEHKKQLVLKTLEILSVLDDEKSAIDAVNGQKSARTLLR
jgi:hypothetical protein